MHGEAISSRDSCIGHLVSAIDTTVVMNFEQLDPSGEVAVNPPLRRKLSVSRREKIVKALVLKVLCGPVRVPCCGPSDVERGVRVQQAQALPSLRELHVPGHPEVSRAA